MAQAAIELMGINKSFGAVRANRDIDLEVERGTIHGIVGENGAGKSTLMSILYGFYKADSGEIFVNGKPSTSTTAHDAIAARHRHGAPALHAGRQFLRARKRHSGRRGRSAACLVARQGARRTEAAGRRIRLARRSRTPSSRTCSVGQQQRVEILKALYRGADILILDEPTAVLTPEEADELFRVLRAAARTGQDRHSHHPQAARDHGDHRHASRSCARARWWPTLKTAETSPEQARRADGRPPRAAAGRKGRRRIPASRCSRSKTSSVATTGRRRDQGRRVSFNVRAGEIVGIAGRCRQRPVRVAGGDRRHARAELGRRDAQRQGPVARAAIDGAARARDCGLAHVPEDRHAMGLVAAVRGVRERHARLPGRSAPMARPVPRHRRDRAGDAGEDRELRRPPAPIRA